MKRCPTCGRTFNDANLSFCIEDGTPLVPVTPAEDETTIVNQSPEARDNPPAQYAPPDWRAPGYQLPGSPYASGAKRKIWPWIAGIFAVLVIGFIGLGIVAALVIPSAMRGGADNQNTSSNSRPSGADSANLNSNESENNSNSINSNETTNTKTDDRESSPPTDADQVLEDLTEIEREWTVANIKADKQKLEQILADDYVGGEEGGEERTKAEYLATLTPATSIEAWEFEDLKVTLKGDRASLSGVLRVQFRNGPAAFEFTDKFVWRDGRWQAVSSSVKQIQ